MSKPDFFAALGARYPVIQAPMAGFGDAALAIAAIRGGGVGSLAGAMFAPERLLSEVATVRASVSGPLNLNFFCHHPPQDADDSAWRALLAPLYAAEGIEPSGDAPPARRPFDAEAAHVVEETRPEIVSFHFGLPSPDLLARVRATGARVIASATNVAEARHLATAGCAAIIAQGFEAGGHAGHFLHGHRPVGTFALVPQIADAVDVPVIAAGGIADARGAAAAIMLGATGVQVGSAYLPTEESLASAVHRAALGGPGAEDSVFTNLFSGGLARGIRNRLIETLGAVNPGAPPFPTASAALAPLRKHAESAGRGDYSPLWAGQAAPLSHQRHAAALTELLGGAALAARRSLA
ncbi:NAD(P)H-dependent flavin oxidoreductase [Sphingomonas lycopersici]|uniref:NAD(P)H-dependent flavin oxidoreductase n=1 Tax=Sphingomonas lycopersici TaxID=2951807 RepID=UPI002237E201|nr:nitronate monooxygenase family protein [Sphingomonas lycopersici]